MDPFWIHCNFCATYYEEGADEFFLMRCSHVACKRCLETRLMKAGKCSYDEKPLKHVPFSKLSDHHKHHFLDDPESPLETIKKANAIIKFRNKQMKSDITMRLQLKVKIEKADEKLGKQEIEYKSLWLKFEQKTEVRVRLQKALYHQLKAQVADEEREEEMRYRDPANSFSSSSSMSFRTPSNTSRSSSSSGSSASFFEDTPSFSSPSSSKHLKKTAIKTEFFNKDSFKLNDSHSSAGRSSIPIFRNGSYLFNDSQKTRTPPMSQNNRKPFIPR